MPFVNGDQHIATRPLGPEREWGELAVVRQVTESLTKKLPYGDEHVGGGKWLGERAVSPQLAGQGKIIRRIENPSP